jgi:hypothetical protein
LEDARKHGRLRDKRLEGLVKNLFRPSYGGNRNYTLMYTLGGLMVSSDDDMRPYALMEYSPESLNTGVAGYDNTFGLPPFFPTRLCFEDYMEFK